MAIAAFTTLDGGEIGLYLTRGVFGLMFSAVLDLALRIEDHFDDELSLPNTPALCGKNVQRGICWILIGIGAGLSDSAWFITAEPKRFGESWQLKPILCDVSFYLLCVWVIGRVLLQAHRGSASNAWRWYVCAYFAFFSLDSR